MLVRTACLATLVVSAAASADRPESNATLVGSAVFSAQPQTDHGSMRLVIRGVADIADECVDARAGKFIATYDGELTVGEDHEFTAPLFPATPTITTPSGCEVHDLDVKYPTSIEVTAQLGELEGRGSLTFQTLTAVKEDDLMKGAFNKLYAVVEFIPEAPCNCGP